MIRKALDRFLGRYAQLQVNLRGLVEDGRGLQTLEWVALAIVILAFLGAVAVFFSNQGENTVGRAVTGAIQWFFERLMQSPMGPLLAPFFPFPIERTG